MRKEEREEEPDCHHSAARFFIYRNFTGYRLRSLQSAVILDGKGGFCMIYCVEDDSAIRELMIYTLRASGFEARGFENDAPFWAAMKEKRPEMIPRPCRIIWSARRLSRR